MKHWADEFQPRSLCSFTGDGPGDTGGFTGGFDPGGDPTSSDVSNDAFFGDMAPASPTGGDTFVSSDPGGFVGGGPTTSSDPGGGFISGSPDGGSSFISGSDPSGFVGPNSDFGYAPSDGWGPTSGVDYAGGPFMSAGNANPSGNLGFGNAIGPPGAMTGDFGLQGYGGPQGTGVGPGSTASIGGPQAYGSPSASMGLSGPPGAQQGDYGAQFGTPGLPGWSGGPATMQPGEQLNPSLFGPEAPTVNPNDRTEVDPATVFGPEFATNQAASNAGWFGPSQAQAGQNMTNQGVIDAANMANAFARTGDDMTAYMAATNPGLAQALSQIATNFQADPANDPANYAGPSPGAQQGFTGTSAQQGTMSFDSFGGKGDSLNQSGRADVQQTNPNFDQIDPMVTQQGYQQLAAEMNAQQPQTPTVQGQQSGVPTVDPATAQQGYQQLADQMNAQQNQQAMIAGQELSEQGKGAPSTQTTPQQTISNAFDALTAANQQQSMQQSAMFDAQARGEQGRGPDSFDSRFGDPSQFNPSSPTLSADALDAQSRGEQGKGEQLAPWAQTETIGLRPGEDVISNLNPATLGAGGGIGIPGLLSMYATDRSEPSGRPGGSPTGNPSQAGVGPFGPSGRPGGDTSGRPGLSITVGNNQYAAGRPGGPGYYQTGGAGIAPGAKGAEYGGVYGRGDVSSTGRPGTNSFGAGGPGSWGAAAAAAARGGGGGYFYDPATGQYYQAGGRR